MCANILRFLRQNNINQFTVKVIKLFYLFSCSSEWHFNRWHFHPFCIFFGLNGLSIYRWSGTLTTEAKVSFWPKRFCDRIQVGLRDSKEALTYIQTGYYVVGVRMNPFKKHSISQIIMQNDYAWRNFHTIEFF